MLMQMQMLMQKHQELQTVKNTNLHVDGTGWMDGWITSPLEHRSLSGANKQTILPQITLMHTTAHKDTAAESKLNSCRKNKEEKEGGKYLQF